MKKEKALTKKQKKAVKKIMKENDRQRKVDKIVKMTKKAMKIYNRESQQGRVDDFVAAARKQKM